MMKIESEDILVWSDGTWCYGEDLEEQLSWMSDDFCVLKCDSKEWLKFVEDIERDM